MRWGRAGAGAQAGVLHRDGRTLPAEQRETCSRGLGFASRGPQSLLHHLRGRVEATVSCRGRGRSALDQNTCSPPQCTHNAPHLENPQVHSQSVQSIEHGNRLGVCSKALVCSTSTSNVFNTITLMSPCSNCTRRVDWGYICFNLASTRTGPLDRSAVACKPARLSAGGAA
jgi:hypothetical protein